MVRGIEATFSAGEEALDSIDTLAMTKATMELQQAPQELTSNDGCTRLDDLDSSSLESHRNDDSVREEQNTMSVLREWNDNCISDAKPEDVSKSESIFWTNSSPEIFTEIEPSFPEIPQADSDCPLRLQNSTRYKTTRSKLTRCRYKKHDGSKLLKSCSPITTKLTLESREDDTPTENVHVKREFSDILHGNASNGAPIEEGKKIVKFAFPLVETLNYRPKTLPEEVDELYFQEEELWDWEEDRENTLQERFELIFRDDDSDDVSVDCQSCSSTESFM